MGRCASCPFKTKAIGSKGPVDSPFVIVGESPGSRELSAGIPFVGPSGVMLNETLAKVGFDSMHTEPYVLNALNCYPANKDLPKLKAGAHACAGRLQEELGAHPRKVIIALGNAAMWATTGNYGLKSTIDRGRVIDTKNGPVVLAVHPAYLLRNGGAYSTWVKDLRQAVEIYQGATPNQWTNPTWSLVTKPSQYNEIVEEYTQQGVGLVTGDVETDAFHWFDGRVLCLGITKGDGSHVDIIPESLFYNQLGTTKRLMENPNPIWNWHNGLFDIKWCRKLGIEARVDEDTMLLSYALNERKGFHDLDQVAQTWIKAPKHKHMLDAHKGEGWQSYRDFPAPVLHEYNAIDLSKTHKVHAPLREALGLDMVRGQQLLKGLYEDILIPAVDFVAEMQLYGVSVDKEAVVRTNAEHLVELERINALIQPYAQKHLGHDVNINSPKQMKELLYTKMGFGRPTFSTDADALEEIMRNYDMPPIVSHLLDYREVSKRRSTFVMSLIDHEKKKSGSKKLHFVKGLTKADGRIHADFKLHGTETGRLAGAEPNLLNQPRGPIVRGQYVAAPGKIFCEIDLNQAELRSLALMSGDPILTEIYTKNEVSIHDVTTGAFFAPKEEVMLGGKLFEQVCRQLHLPLSTPPKTVYGEAKMRGKAVNFGIVYGREAFSLAKEFNISIAEAQRWIDAWLNTYSEAGRFIKWCREAPAKNRDLITVYGRKKRHGVVAPEKLRALQNEAANFPHQSTASDIMLETAIIVHRPLAKQWDAHIWNEVYDAIYFEVDASDQKLGEIIPYVQGVITEVPRKRGLTRIPFLGDAKVGYTWGKMSDWKGSIAETLG